MFERLAEFRDQVRGWWESVGKRAEAQEAPDERFLVFFRPEAARGLPAPLQQAAAAGTLATIVALGGVALVCFAGVLLALFGIYLLVTQVLGLELDVDPRLWRQATA